MLLAVTRNPPAGHGPMSASSTMLVVTVAPQGGAAPAGPIGLTTNAVAMRAQNAPTFHPAFAIPEGLAAQRRANSPRAPSSMMRRLASKSAATSRSARWGSSSASRGRPAARSSSGSRPCPTPPKNPADSIIT